MIVVKGREPQSFKILEDEGGYFGVVEDSKRINWEVGFDLIWFAWDEERGLVRQHHRRFELVCDGVLLAPQFNEQVSPFEILEDVEVRRLFFEVFDLGLVEAPQKLITGWLLTFVVREVIKIDHEFECVDLLPDWVELLREVFVFAGLTSQKLLGLKFGGWKIKGMERCFGEGLGFEECVEGFDSGRWRPGLMHSFNFNQAFIGVTLARFVFAPKNVVGNFFELFGGRVWELREIVVYVLNSFAICF